MDDDEPEEGRSPQEADYEPEEEEQDPDCPYQSIIQDLNLETGGDVLHIGLPALSPFATVPSILKAVAVAVIASADGAVRVLQIPLAPPEDSRKENVVTEIVRSQIQLSAGGPVPSAIATKFLPADVQGLPVQRRQHDDRHQLLVASADRSLSIWTISITETAMLPENSKRLHKTPLESPTTHLAFHPSSRSSSLLLADHSGAARVFDLRATKTLGRPASSDSAHSRATSIEEPGNWIVAFQAPYRSAKDSLSNSALVRRKKILDAQWVLSGKGIITLLDDGHWGIWDATGSMRRGKNVDEFVIDGYLASAASNEPVESSLPRKGLSKLAPMTPNTRKSKAEQLFTAPAKVSGAAPRGGISVASNHSRSGQADESLVMWYDSDVYSVTSMQSFWQRSNSNGGGLGSLYTPGLAHISDLNLFNENITSISQFSWKSSTTGIGQMNTLRDLLLATESRAIILLALRPPSPSRTLFEVPERPASAYHDQQMLDAGALSTEGLDRMIDSMQAGNAAPRRVGFAS